MAFEESTHKIQVYSIKTMVSGCGAVGSALPWGGRGRKFKSCHSDQNRKVICFKMTKIWAYSRHKTLYLVFIDDCKLIFFFSIFPELQK